MYLKIIIEVDENFKIIKERRKEDCYLKQSWVMHAV